MVATMAAEWSEIERSEDHRHHICWFVSLIGGNDIENVWRWKLSGLG
jgi:hypothetical protein